MPPFPPPTAAPFRPPAVRSGYRCDRGSDPSVPELATEGLTHCRAPLHESPAPPSSERSPPFRCSASSFPSLPGVRPPVASRAMLGGTSGQTPCASSVALFRPPAVRSGCRCDRGSDPAVPELATEGQTHCRAPLHESPALHRSDRRPLSTCPAQQRPAASFLPPHGIGENASISHLDD